VLLPELYDSVIVFLQHVVILLNLRLVFMDVIELLVIERPVQLISIPVLQGILIADRLAIVIAVVVH
tara:strand:+ start:297 stop:497 length:201 start_codon:yes stop_codon:yes gene_type:complete